MLKIRRGCPNCLGEIESSRLEKGLVCEKCLKGESEDLCGELLKRGKLLALSPFCQAGELEEKFRELFVKALGSQPWSLQRQWAKRVFTGESFAMVAPAGVGKTTFGLILSLFLEGKSLLVFPTKLLAIQAFERLTSFAERAGVKKDLLLYKPSPRIRQRVRAGDFQILVGTNMFLRKNLETLKEIPFSFVFVDDIDSFLKSTRSVTGLFELLGFSPHQIERAIKGEEPGNAARKGPVLVISSATLKPRQKVLLLFRKLLGFDVQRASSLVRNILDVQEPVSGFEEAIEKGISLVKRIGKGGLVFVSMALGREGAKVACDRFRSAGVSCLLYDELSPEELKEKLEKGEVEVVMGISHSGNPLVRGIDLPHAIRYVIHLDVPKHIFPFSPTMKPASLLGLITAIYPVLEEEDRLKALSFIRNLRRYSGIREEALEKYPAVKKRVEEAAQWIGELLGRKEFLRHLNDSPEVSLKTVDGRMSIVVGDAASYLQASARASRLVAGKLTRGVSFLFWQDAKAFRSLQKRLSYYFPNQEVKFLPLEEVNLQEEFREVDRDRELARAVMEGKIPPAVRDLFKTTLVIVESPNKARTIAGFFGKPQVRAQGRLLAYEIPLGERLLTITASLGHVLDLVVDRGFFGVEEGGRFVPVYDTIKTCSDPKIQHTEENYIKEKCRGELFDKASLLEGLKKLAFQADEVFIATDPDSEGEKIAYDLFLYLRPFNPKIQRAEFHEVRPAAFRAAVENPRDFSTNMVKAQMVRRVVDRWVGFVLSRMLWQRFSKNWFSAGRVQTPVLGWIIQREKEARRKKARIFLYFGDYSLDFDLEDLNLARRLKEHRDGIIFRLEEERREEISPLPPYSTDTLLEDAGTKLKFSAPKTMEFLQELFEKGYITYHRTDSTRVSEAGKYSVAKPFITEKFGEEYFFPRTWGQGGAHECIRPTRPLEPDELRMMERSGLVSFSSPGIISLYRLIFRRFMASQMRKAEVKKSSLVVALNGFSRKMDVVLEVLSHGFDLIFGEIKLFPGPEKFSGLAVKLVPLKPLFTQGSLVAEMKRRGLGRPSTYAHIIQTLISRGYVRQVRGKLLSTPMGREVYSYLRENYPEYVSEELTRKLEEAMDQVESGKADWQEVLRAAYRIRELLQ